MCNARAITNPIEGPATDALERFTKRRRSENRPGCLPDHFSFHGVFHDLVGVQEEEAFPSIAWNFEDDEVDCPSALQEALGPVTSAMLGIKRPRSSRSGLLRSKSFKKDLAQLNSGSTSDHLAALAVAIEPLPTKLDDTAQIFTHRLSSSSILASLPSRISKNHAHSLMGQIPNYKR